MNGTAFLTNHERLDVWQRAMELLAESYRVARLLPTEERYGLSSQIRRAAVSVAANIAEGSGRQGTGDRLRFLSFSRGSLCELRTLLSAVEVLGYATAAELTRARELSELTAQLLGGFQRYVRNQRSK